MIETIKERKLAEGILILNEVVKPVAEKWNDGLVHETDNLQITFKSVAKNDLEDVMAYLYYFDKEGNELGHEFDIPEQNLQSGIKARVSFILVPPEGFAYSVLEFKAQPKKNENHGLKLGALAMLILLVYALEKWW